MLMEIPHLVHANANTCYYCSWAREVRKYYNIMITTTITTVVKFITMTTIINTPIMISIVIIDIITTIITKTLPRRCALVANSSDEHECLADDRTNNS